MKSILADIGWFIETGGAFCDTCGSGTPRRSNKLAFLLSDWVTEVVSVWRLNRSIGFSFFYDLTGGGSQAKSKISTTGAFLGIGSTFFSGDCLLKLSNSSFDFLDFTKLY